MPLLIWKSILIRKLVSNHIVLFFQDSSIRWIMLISREFCFHLSMSFNTKRGYGGDFTFCKVIFNDIQGQVWSAHPDHSSLFLPWRNRDLRVPEKQAFLSGGISKICHEQMPFRSCFFSHRWSAYRLYLKRAGKSKVSPQGDFEVLWVPEIISAGVRHCRLSRLTVGVMGWSAC